MGLGAGAREDEQGWGWLAWSEQMELGCPRGVLAGDSLMKYHVDGEAEVCVTIQWPRPIQPRAFSLYCDLILHTYSLCSTSWDTCCWRTSHLPGCRSSSPCCCSSSSLAWQCLSQLFGLSHPLLHPHTLCGCLQPRLPRMRRSHKLKNGGNASMSQGLHEAP